jgi:hypothetical protein
MVLIHHSHDYQRDISKPFPHYSQPYTNKGKLFLQDVREVTVHLTSLVIISSHLHFMDTADLHGHLHGRHRD